jgi:glutamate racemase
MHLVITDSGLGGLAVCAAAEKALCAAGTASEVRITYFNAWPEQERGYNDMPDIASRARAFEPALAGMAALHPDRIVIACNTLSVVYQHTTFSRTTAIPVLGIVDAGIQLFHEALCADADGSIVMFGTRTTIESDVHRQGLIGRGIDSGRIAAVACHGLARTIETDPDGSAIPGFIDTCTTAACEGHPPGTRLYLGVCCTHYTYVRDEMRAALERRCRRPVHTLDPGARLAAEVLRLAEREGRVSSAATVESPKARSVGAELAPPRAGPDAAPEPGAPGTPRHSRCVMVTVVSKVEMDDRKRRAMARRVEAVSPATAAAVLAYTRVPDLF